jgi:molecular chaperone DnaK
MHEPVVGIDLGTSTSAVATVEDGKPRVLANRAGHPLTPSMVGFRPDGVRVVGEAARSLAEEQPANVAAATKRFIGRRWSRELAHSARALVRYPLIEGPSGEIRVRVGGKVLPLTQVSAMILGELKLDAEVHFGRPVHKCVITVPANFDDLQRAPPGRRRRSPAHARGCQRAHRGAAAGLTAQFQGKAPGPRPGGGTLDVQILEVEAGSSCAPPAVTRCWAARTSTPRWCSGC